MLKKLHSVLLACILIIIHISCKQQPDLNNTQIAFMADVHLNDIYGEFKDSDFKGMQNPGNGQYVLARTMKAQLHSTRIFNENYFAFLAALDDIVQKGIKHVVLPGDFSDDGQPYNVRGLKHILDQYSADYGIRFFAITGNHDPVGPYTMEAGKTDFLGKDGKSQVIMSKAGLYHQQSEDENPVVITKDICKLGYEEIVNTLGNNGFLPQKSYKYWETPFTTYNYEEYDYKTAMEQSDFNLRAYTVSKDSVNLPDVSYLVEPFDGLWLLALDGNVYLPSDNTGYGFIKAGAKNSSEYSNIIAHKKHLITWINKVVEESERRNKTLITFSHYPMIDCYDGAVDDMKALFGKEKMQLHRAPAPAVAELFAKMGLKLHFAGHMHMNDTGIKTYDDGSFLVNIQVPSLASYPTAYKILTIKDQNKMEIETVKIDDVPRFNTLFPLYEKEYNYLTNAGNKNTWNKEILNSKNYKELMNWHLKELVRLRFLEKDWPENFRSFMLNQNGHSLLSYAGVTDFDTTMYASWTGFDMILDFYRLLNADQLAHSEIEENRLLQYQAIIQAELSKNQKEPKNQDSLHIDFHKFASIFNQLLHSEPSNHFEINIHNGELTELKN